MRRPALRAAALAVAAAIALSATAPARAAGATTLAACSERFTASVAPGLTLMPTSGTVASNGQTGSIACSGQVAGHRITGPGTIGTVQTFAGATCASQVNTGIARIVLPTTAGLVDMSGSVTVRRTALAIGIKARFPNASYSAVGATIPVQGTCFVTPLRKVLVTAIGVLRGG